MANSMLDISRQLFGSERNASSSVGGNDSHSLSMRYGTAQEDVSDGKVVVLLDGSDEAVIVQTFESIKKGQRVTVYNSNGLTRAICLSEGSVGGDLVNVDTVMTNKLFANEGYIQNLTAETIKATTGSFGQIYADAIEAGTIKAETIAADLVETDELKAGIAIVTNAEIGNATIKQAQVQNLNTDFAHISNGVIDNATIDQAKVNDLEANYAKIDRTNIDEGWVKDLMVQGKFVAQDGTLYKLTGLHIDANDITTGVLTVDRLQLLGSDGLYYALNVNAMGETEIEKLPADVQRECQSKLHADSLVANSITTDHITTNNLVGTGGWINLAAGTFEYSNASSGNYILWDGSKLKIRANEITLGTSSLATKADVDNVQVGGRNYCPKSKNLEGFIVENSGNTKCELTDEYSRLYAVSASTAHFGIYRDITVEPNTDYVLSFDLADIVGTAKLGVGREGAIWSGIVSHTSNPYTVDGRKAVKFNTSQYTWVRLYFTLMPSTNSSFKVSNLKLEKGNKATDWTQAPEDVQVGARNLAPMSHWFGGAQRSVWTGNKSDTHSTSSSEPRGFCFCHTSDILSGLTKGVKVLGEEITISFDFKLDSGGTSGRRINVYAYQQNGVSIYGGYTIEASEMTTSWKRVSFTTNAYNWGDNGTYTTGAIYIYDTVGTNSYSVRNIKIERGNKATDWTPAPEDVDKSINDAKEAAIQVAADAIKSWVSSAGGNTSYTQTSTGFTWETSSNVSGVDSTARLGIKVQDFGSDVKVFYDTCAISENTGTVVGRYLIYTPIVPNRMTSVHITGYNYNMHIGSTIDLIVNFYVYNNSSSDFINYDYVNNGTLDIGYVGVAHKSANDASAVIIIGKDDSSWYYPKLRVESATLSFNAAPNSFKDGWSIQRVTSIPSTFTKLTEIPERGLAAKTAKAYMDFNQTNASALTIGNKTAGSWSGTRAVLGPSALDFQSANGTSLANYGASSSRIGPSNSGHVIVAAGSDAAHCGLEVMNGNTEYAWFGGNGAYLRDSSGVLTGKFEGTQMQVGKDAGSNFYVDVNGHSVALREGSTAYAKGWSPNLTNSSEIDKARWECFGGGGSIYIYTHAASNGSVGLYNGSNNQNVMSYNHSVRTHSIGDNGSDLRFDDKILYPYTNNKVPLGIGGKAFQYVSAYSYPSQSSRTVKDNIEPMTEDEARKILEVEAVTYDYKDESSGLKGQRGVIAEDVAGIIPFVINNERNAPIDKDGTEGLGVDYSKFVPYLIKMIQVQEQQIQQLTARIDELEGTHGSDEAIHVA